MELVTPNVNISIILPELIVAFTGIVAMVYDSFFPKDRVTTGIISLVGLALSAVFLADAWSGGAYGFCFRRLGGRRRFARRAAAGRQQRR